MLNTRKSKISFRELRRAFATLNTAGYLADNKNESIYIDGRDNILAYMSTEVGDANNLSSERVDTIRENLSYGNTVINFFSDFVDLSKYGAVKHVGPLHYVMRVISEEEAAANKYPVIAPQLDGTQLYLILDHVIVNDTIIPVTDTTDSLICRMYHIFNSGGYYYGVGATHHTISLSKDGIYPNNCIFEISGSETTGIVKNIITAMTNLAVKHGV